MRYKMNLGMAKERRVARCVKKELDGGSNESSVNKRGEQQMREAKDKRKARGRKKTMRLKAENKRVVCC